MDDTLGSIFAYAQNVLLLNASLERLVTDVESINDLTVPPVQASSDEVEINLKDVEAMRKVMLQMATLSFDITKQSAAAARCLQNIKEILQ